MRHSLSVAEALLPRRVLALAAGGALVALARALDDGAAGDGSAGLAVAVAAIAVGAKLDEEAAELAGEETMGPQVQGDPPQGAGGGLAKQRSSAPRRVRLAGLRPLQEAGISRSRSPLTTA